MTEDLSPPPASPGELVGDVAGADGQLHGGEEGGVLLPGAHRPLLLEHGQLQRRHGVPGRAAVRRPWSVSCGGPGGLAGGWWRRSQSTGLI